MFSLVFLRRAVLYFCVIFPVRCAAVCQVARDSIASRLASKRDE